MLKENYICISNLLCNTDKDTPLSNNFIDVGPCQVSILIDGMYHLESK